ncbi:MULTISPECIES: efflux RND transporter permease subunit [unclassified Wenzhouxiangella]|uniref:efflux RND transporter permease subunit n=1 Tax=unclassified Wenzhouxiangella TaxID=2613841 RepID=UPI000E32B8DD|nr:MULTISPECIES: efflux RND transporter permease subunit [unclassified Wenzhouxiangella]RFF27924.1 efflux RND transporter permease subunit [Wenzhouxiangella sp. 15181]RFP67199.1 efflux RND transporter permease subunit [Wenzhouxiangella sp. 15190]
MSDSPTGDGLHARGPIAWMVRNPIAANLAMIILLAGGVWTAISMQKEVQPRYELDYVDVSVSYPGAAPEEVEQGILLPVEESVRGVQGIKELTSTAREGSGSISLELVAGVNRMRVYQDIDQAVAQIRTFPVDAEEPEVRLRSWQRDVMEIGLYGDVDTWTLRQLGERVRDQLLTQPNITQVEIGNVPSYVTHVEISQDVLREYNLTLAQVADLIEQSSRDVPAGAIDTSRGEILLRMKERREWAREMADIVLVSSETGAPLRLGDIAEVRDGFEEAGFHSQFNRQPSIEIEIFRVGTQSPLEVAESVQTVLDDLENALPEGVTWRIDSNRAEEFSDRLNLLLKNGALAIIIILLILALFLEARLAFWIMMGMTISFVGAINFLPGFGISINMISMFGFLVALGIVVDDAIVVGENIYEHRERGLGMMDAAVTGAREIAWPVTFSILTNIVAFLPVMFIPGIMGQYWWPMPVVVVTVLALSLLEALFILPSHLAHIRERSHATVGETLHTVQRRFSRGFAYWIDTRYKPFLEMCLRHRYVTLTGAITLLAVTGGYALSDHLGMIMMPEQPADEIEAGVRLPVGTTRDVAADMAAQITNATHQMFEDNDLYEAAEGIKTNVRGSNFIDVEIVMLPPAERDISTQEVIELWRNQIGDIKGVDQITFEAERGPGSWRDDISIDLSHSDIGVLEHAAAELVERLEAFGNTRDVNDNYERGKAQLDFTLLPEGRALGLTPVEVGRQLRGAFYGDIAMRYLRGTNEIEVRVKLPEEAREDIRTLENFMVRTPDGVEVPLSDVARVEPGKAFTSINRRDGRRVINVGTDVEPKSAVSRVLAAVNEDVLPQLRADFPGITWTYEGSQAELRESTAALWGGFGLALFAVYALLAIAFSSYIQPLIVMLAIPFGIVGGIIGHVLLGYDLSLVSMLGVVAVSGVVVNGALIMVHFANRKRTEMSAHDAILAAGTRRFRPIVLTTVTTFGGLAPIILETSIQAVHLVPMAISLGFGILFATSIMLVVVPCFYMILEDIHEGVQRRRSVSA